jgi:hypothetical protein
LLLLLLLVLVIADLVLLERGRKIVFVVNSASTDIFSTGETKRLIYTLKIGGVVERETIFFCSKTCLYKLFAEIGSLSELISIVLGYANQCMHVCCKKLAAFSKHFLVSIAIDSGIAVWIELLQIFLRTFVILMNEVLKFTLHLPAF